MIHRERFVFQHRAHPLDVLAEVPTPAPSIMAGNGQGEVPHPNHVTNYPHLLRQAHAVRTRRRVAREELERRVGARVEEEDEALALGGGAWDAAAALEA